MNNKKQWISPKISELTIDSTEAGVCTSISENGECHT
jgi:hypothetical protein